MRARLSRLFVDGTAGNERLTATTAVVLLVLLAVEGATIPFLGPLLTVHVFVGMLLIPPVGLKLASTGYRFARYYTHAAEYVAKGPPRLVLRTLVAPVVVVSTVVLFASGVALAVVGPDGGAERLAFTLHKASFIVWVAAMGVHVLVYAVRLPRLVSERDGAAGRLLRRSLVGGAVAAGVAVALATLPLAHAWTQR